MNSIEAIGGVEFGRCGVCGGRTSVERATDEDTDGACFVCQTYGAERRGMPVGRDGRARPIYGPTPLLTRQYREYLDSPEWKVRRREAIDAAGKRCKRCGRAGALMVHHLTYERLGHELPGDLEVVCKVCHPEADRQRRPGGESARFAGFDQGLAS